MMLDAEAFRTVIGRFTSGVSVITTSHDGRDWGMTASALCSVSLEPPKVLICVNRDAPTGSAVCEAGHFAINILDADQRWVAEGFAQPRTDKFADVDFRRGGSGDPILADCLAILECQVAQEVVAGSHRVLIADVLYAEANEAEPLAYYRGAFGRFELAQYSDAYRQLFTMILSRELPLDAPLEPRELSAKLTLPLSAITYALTRLIGDGLVSRDPELGYRQVAFDPSHAIESYQAKRALDLAAADMTVGKVSAPSIARLRTLADRANSYVTPEGIRDIPGYRAATLAFQEALVGLTRNRAFSSTIASLRIPELISIPQQATRVRAAEIALNRTRIVAGYEAGDVEMTKRALSDQADLHIEVCLDLMTKGGRPL